LQAFWFLLARGKMEKAQQEARDSQSSSLSLARSRVDEISTKATILKEEIENEVKFCTSYQDKVKGACESLQLVTTLLETQWKV